jgi:threonine/homoserine/homoserine lactone efflux protein
MDFAWDLLVFTAALAVAAFSPGPGLAAIIAATLASGARRVVWFCAGVIAGDLAWLALSLSGLALIAQKIPVVFLAIKWAGVVYLAWLAVKIWRSSPDPAKIKAKAPDRSPWARVLAGFSITMGNPKAMLFYLALLPSIITPEALTLPMVLSLCLSVVLVLATVFLIYVSAAEKARSAMTSSRAVKRFNRATAAALGGAAAWIASR